MQLQAEYHFDRASYLPSHRATPEHDITFVLIATFVSVALCALIGWAFIRVLGSIANKLRRRTTPAAHRASDPTIIFRDATLEELVEGGRPAASPPPMGDVETYFENGRWKNKVQGNSRASNVHESWAAAVKAGREMARKRRVEHIIRKKESTIAEVAAAV